MKAFAYVMSSAPLQNQILRRNLFVEKIIPLSVKYPLADEVLHHYREPFPTSKSRIGVAEFPRQFMERFRQDFNLVTVQRLDAKHFIQEDQPGDIVTAIEAFLNRPGLPA